MSYTGTPLLGESQHRGTEPPTEARRIAAALKISEDSEEDACLVTKQTRESQPAGPAFNPPHPSGSAAVAATAEPAATGVKAEMAAVTAASSSAMLSGREIVSETQNMSSRVGATQNVPEPCSDVCGALAALDLGSPYPSPAFFARNMDVLPSGHVPTLCLWAVELRIRHPITDVELHLLLPDPPEFRDLLAENGGVCAS